ncbi:MAG TPA: DUF2750 domain-containing protein [Nannocystaceae bacterium]|nr:DUF2750 domain-containing protein [Nannocystaceae bacterium]
MRQRIVSLSFPAPPDWTRVAAGLGRLVAGADVQLVRTAEKQAVIVVVAADGEAIDRIERDVVLPWLDDVGAKRKAAAIEGEIVWPSAEAPHDTNDDERVARFVAGVRASGSVWGLRKKTWARSSAGNGREALPLWPDEESAALCIGGDWSRYRARPIALDGFLAEWLPGMVEDGIVAVVLPTPDHPGAVVSADTLLAALQAG